jgi:hypothetical protein
LWEEIGMGRLRCFSFLVIAALSVILGGAEVLANPKPQLTPLPAAAAAGPSATQAQVAGATPPGADARAKAELAAKYGRLPMHFELNRGQAA